MMAEMTNPAQRLYDIVQGVITYGEETYSDAHPDFPIATVRVADVWMETLGISPEAGDRSGFYVSLTGTLRLIDLCEQTSKRCEAMNSEDLELYLEDLGRLRSFIFGIDAMNWPTFRQDFSDDFLRSFRWPARIMSREFDETVIPTDELEELQAEARELASKVLDSELSSDLKRTLSEALLAIDGAIGDYKVAGAGGIRGALDQTVGAMTRHRDAVDKALESGGKAVLSECQKFIVKSDGVVSGASGVAPLTGSSV